MKVTTATKIKWSTKGEVISACNYDYRTLSSEGLPRIRKPERGNLELERRVMPLFMDIHHHVEGLTAKAVAGAHQRDVEVGTKHGVKYQRYWFDEATGKIFCLVQAPSKEAAATVHKEAHGLLADEIIQVKEGS